MTYFSAYHKGKQLYKKGNYSEALEQFKTIDVKSLTNTDESVVHHFSALCYSYLGNLNKSVYHFKRAVKCRPHSSQICIDMGRNYLFFHEKKIIPYFILKIIKQKNFLEKAQKCFEDGLLINAILSGPESAELWYYRGYMLELLGNIDEAKKSYKKCKTLNKKIKNLEKSKLFSTLKPQKKYQR